MVAPKGLGVEIGPSTASAVSVQLSGPGEQFVKLNQQQIPLANLQNALAQVLQSKNEKTVQVIADGALYFADVVHVIDACRLAGAKGVLLAPAVNAGSL